MTHVALRISLSIALLATGPAWGRGAPARADSCPLVTVSCPESFVVGQPATFTATIVGGDPSWEPTFNWTVSAGVIISGQKTISITVDTTGLGGQTIEATVKVENMIEPCPKTASCLMTGWVCGYGRPIDSYGNIRFNDEKARLDNFAIELQNDPTARGYVVAYGGCRGRAGEAQRRADRAKDYLVNTRGIDASRLFIIDGGHREDLTVDIFVWPRDVAPPTPSPTVDPSEVVIIPDEPAPKRPPRRPRRRT